MRGFARLAAIAAATGALLVISGCASSTSTAAPSPPAVGTTPLTLTYYSVSTENTLYSSTGQAITDPNATPAAGDYFVSADNDYSGTQKNHSKAIAGSDHAYCVITQAPATGICSVQLALGSSMILFDHSVQNFASNSPTIVFTITSGTGAYKGVHGTVKVTHIGNTNNSNAVLTVSK